VHRAHPAALTQVADPLPEGDSVKGLHGNGVHNTLELILVKIDNQRHGIIRSAGFVEGLEVLREVAVVEKSRKSRYLIEKAATVVPPEWGRHRERPVCRAALLVERSLRRR
jgi:hypothetical protein